MARHWKAVGRSSRTARGARLRLGVGQVFQDAPRGRDLTLDVILRVMFGVEDGGEAAHLMGPFETLFDRGVSAELTPRVALQPLGGLKHWPKLERANRGIDELVTPMIAARRHDLRSARP